MVETGVAQLDGAAQQEHNSAYLWCLGGRTASRCCRAIETAVFFQKLRGDLLVTLYNNKEVWPKFGYEGASADKGGYINRGFNDIDWLPQAKGGDEWRNST